MTAETPHNFCEYMEQHDKATFIPKYTGSLSQDTNPLQSDKKGEPLRGQIKQEMTTYSLHCLRVLYGATL